MRVYLEVVWASVVLLSFSLTLLLERLASVTGLIDVPNSRSSHVIPTPRGGGLAIVIASLVVETILVVRGALPERLYIGVVGGGILVATIGFIDDRRPLSATLRLVVHFIAASWTVAWLGPIPLIGGSRPGLVAQGFDFGLCTVGVVWFLNIFNFMDGIDGIAASETIFACGGLLLLACVWTRNAGVAIVSAMLGGAVLGFLPRNWPTARIFMGDAGSGYAGFMIAALGMVQGVQRPVLMWSWVILVGVFVADSSVTLIRRIGRGEALAVAHRTHAYQKLALRFGHRSVTIGVIGVNLLWLLPCVVVSALLPQDAPLIAAVALLPLIFGAIVVKAGAPA